MKEYLRALKSLTRICGLLRGGSEIPTSSVVYYTEECLKQFVSAFGSNLPGASKVTESLTAAVAAINNKDVTEYLRLIAAANITI